VRGGRLADQHAVTFPGLLGSGPAAQRAALIRELFDEGHTLAAALRILALEDDLAAERALTARLHERLAGQDRPDEG
jgi:hypothetical protein